MKCLALALILGVLIATFIPVKLANHRTEKDKKFRFNAVVTAYAGFHMATNGKSWLDASNTVWTAITDSLEIQP